MNARTAVFVLVALTVAVIALSTGTTVYYLLAIMPAMMAILSLASVLLTLTTLHVTAAAQRKRVSRGDSVGISLTVGRRSFLPVGAVELEVSTPGENREVGRMSVSVPPLKSRQYRYNIRCAHRGVYEVGVSRVSVTVALESAKPSAFAVRVSVRVPMLSNVTRAVNAPVRDAFTVVLMPSPSM